jgi:hypothetical protein
MLVLLDTFRPNTPRIWTTPGSAARVIGPGQSLTRHLVLANPLLGTMARVRRAGLRLRCVALWVTLTRRYPGPRGQGRGPPRSRVPALLPGDRMPSPRAP